MLRVTAISPFGKGGERGISISLKSLSVSLYERERY
jgi:hypothetical protein